VLVCGRIYMWSLLLTSYLTTTECFVLNVLYIGVEPTTEATTSGNGVHRLFSRIFARCVTAPVSLQQAATAVCSLCTDDKYKGSCLYNLINLLK